MKIAQSCLTLCDPVDCSLPGSSVQARILDTASVNPNRLAVMPRMSAISSGGAQQIKSETVESMLRDSAAELDDYFTKAYGFDPDAE